MKEQQKRKIQQFHPEIEDGTDLRRWPLNQISIMLPNIEHTPKYQFMLPNMEHTPKYRLLAVSRGVTTLFQTFTGRKCS